MKKLLLLFSVSMILFACNNEEDESINNELNNTQKETKSTDSDWPPAPTIMTHSDFYYDIPDYIALYLSNNVNNGAFSCIILKYRPLPVTGDQLQNDTGWYYYHPGEANSTNVYHFRIEGFNPGIMQFRQKFRAEYFPKGNGFQVKACYATDPNTSSNYQSTPYSPIWEVIYYNPKGFEPTGPDEGLTITVVLTVYATIRLDNMNGWSDKTFNIILPGETTPTQRTVKRGEMEIIYRTFTVQGTTKCALGKTATYSHQLAGGNTAGTSIYLDPLAGTPPSIIYRTESITYYY
ncbi:MAG: hypothetical protein ACK5KT_07315 [Dysgonomonas sp.]